MLNNIAAHHLGHEVSQHWSYRFVHGNAQYLIGVYLNGFDKVRKIAQQPDAIDKFFENVSDIKAVTVRSDVCSF